MNNPYYPSSKRDALTLLYLSRQDLTDKSPGELAELYNSVYEEITKKFNELAHNGINKD